MCYNVFMLEIELCNPRDDEGHLRMMIKEPVNKFQGKPDDHLLIVL